jgi:hypothetical protein
MNNKQQELETLLTIIENLKNALEKYATHLDDCEYVWVAHGRQEKCTCGLSELIDGYDI